MLLQTASDKSPNVVEAVNTSLRKIADNNTNEVLLACCSAVENTAQTNTDHVRVILSIMKKICEDHIQKIDDVSIVTIIQLCVRIVKQSNGYDPTQQLTCDILVALGREYHVLVSISCFRAFRNN